MNSNEIGRYIRVLRKREGMSQERLGELLELSYQQVQKYEQGKSKITLELLSRVSEVFSIPVTQLLEASAKEYSSPHLSGDAADAGEYERRELQETELLRQFRKLNTPFSREFVLRWIRGIAELERQCSAERPGAGSGSDENHDPRP
jgi:transcriptional regulator with XRE-family HTH domain